MCCAIEMPSTEETFATMTQNIRNRGSAYCATIPLAKSVCGTRGCWSRYGSNLVVGFDGFWSEWKQLLKSQPGHGSSETGQLASPLQTSGLRADTLDRAQVLKLARTLASIAAFNRTIPTYR